MVADPRILVYRNAAQAMINGRFDADVPFVAAKDEIDHLGTALHELGHTLERKFREIDRLSHVTAQVNAGLILDEVLDHVY